MSSCRFLTVSLSPALQKTLTLGRIKIGEVNRASAHRLDTAGKGVNVSRVLAQLGQEVTHLLPLGGYNRDEFLRMASEDGFKLLWTDSGSPVRFCYTLLDPENQTVTELVEEGPTASEGSEEKLMKLFHKSLEEHDWLIISGSRPAGYSDSLFPEMTRLAREKGLKVMLDFRRQDLLDCLPHSPDYIKPNFMEFVETFFPGRQASEQGNHEELMSQVEAKMLELAADKAIITVLTRGSRETLYTDDGSIARLKPQTIKAVSTIGCGDAFTAGLAAALAENRKLEDAVRQGQDCARRNALSIRPGVIQS